MNKCLPKNSPKKGCHSKEINNLTVKLKLFKAFLPLCTIFKSYHINAEKSLSTNFSPHF
ncbi:hypothetical protein [Spiroplasma ixodetis]|uniref:hypothetical protein n=1 Tax=Spiroplasma ixodetis TaxID=2141 RepID=UPI0024912F22|nr:hypothetical protein [Spiroplasma ixodetis]